MPVVSVAGQIITPLVVRPGIEAKYCKRGNGKYDKPADYLPKSNYLHIITVAGVYNDIFFSCATDFVVKPEYLRCDGGKPIHDMDGYASHISYKALNLLRESRIIFVGLPAHTLYVLQSLDVSLFGPLKLEFKMLLSVMISVPSFKYFMILIKPA